jgi:foldase protein PrsA
VNRISRLLPALGAFFVAAIAVAGCGDSVPGNAVARVGDTSITRVSFDHWFKIATASNPTGGTYDPPGFTSCVATKRKTAPKPAKGQPATTDAQFKSQCKQEYEGLRDQVMQFLVLAKWVNGEAADQGVKISAKESDAAYTKQIKEAFPKKADLDKFLKQSGMSLGDARFQINYSTVYTKLREKAIKGADKVTDKSIAAFYAKNKSRFATPETRDIRFALTKTKSKADAALAALKGGQSWTKVTKRYSIDDASKGQGGKLLGVAKGSQEKAFDTALFAAPKGKLTGPVKVQFGYYIFQVQKITPAKQQSLKEASPAIRQELLSTNQKAADDKFNAALRKKWKAKTNCRKGYVMDQCKNAPKPKTTAAPAGQVQAPPAQQQQQVPPAQPTP